MHVCLYTDGSVPVYWCVCLCTGRCVPVYVCVCLFTCVCACIWVCALVYGCVHLYMGVCTCVYLCVCLWMGLCSCVRVCAWDCKWLWRQEKGAGFPCVWVTVATQLRFWEPILFSVTAVDVLNSWALSLATTTPSKKTKANKTKTSHHTDSKTRIYFIFSQCWQGPKSFSIVCWPVDQKAFRWNIMFSFGHILLKINCNL